MRKTLYWLAACSLVAIAVLALWEDHRGHVIGSLPYLLLLACPIMHLLMHRGHDRHDTSHQHHVRS